MVWLQDPLTGADPQRTLIEEEDEQQAQEVAPQYSAVPEVQWSPGVEVPSSPTVLFLLGQAACLLSGASFPAPQPIGRICVTELVRVRSPLEEEFGPRHAQLHTCLLQTSGSSGGGSRPLLVVACPRELPAEQAAAWARHLLATLRPRAVAVAATLPAQSYRGPGSPADDDLVFSLHSTATAEAAGGTGTLPPPLPPAALLGGLPAALLLQCERKQLAAALVVGVLQQQVPDAAFLYSLGQAACAGLRCAGGEGSAAALQQHQQPPSKAAATAALSAVADAVYRSSACSSIFA